MPLGIANTVQPEKKKKPFTLGFKSYKTNTFSLKEVVSEDELLFIAFSLNADVFAG